MRRAEHGRNAPGAGRGMVGRLAVVLVALTTALAGCEPPDVGPETGVSFPEGWPYAMDAPAATAEHGMAATTNAHATDAGVDALRSGGNAVDAMVAIHFALAVVHPAAGNIGGGGFMVRRSADDERHALDFREKAPMAATRDMYLDEEGRLTDASVVGHLASGVPGSVMGMWRAHRRFGSKPWAELVRPAVELARDGFVVDERFHRSLAGRRDELARFEASAEKFFPDGAPPAVGDTFRQPDLAATLGRIAEDGPDGFYAGRTADLIVREMERGGGIITKEDLASYDVAWRDPAVFDYRGHTVISMPPSSSGGPTMAELANILEGWDLSDLGFHSSAHVHLFAEAAKRAYVDRNAYLTDPDFIEMPLERMMSDAYAAGRRAGIELGRATPSTDVNPGMGPPDSVLVRVRESRNTTHYSIVDSAGTAVSVTTTINSGYGSKVTVAGAGFVLNNEMDDFAAKPGTPNQFGLVQGEANAVEPGKRMLSAMTPSIVLSPDGRLRFVTGTPGGSTIITTVFQTISNVVDFGMGVSGSVNAPRVHHQHLPDRIYYEAGGLPDEVVLDLESKGHTVVERSGRSGDVAAIMVLPDGTLEGYSDPRRGGTAAGH